MAYASAENVFTLQHDLPLQPWAAAGEGLSDIYPDEEVLNRTRMFREVTTFLDKGSVSIGQRNTRRITLAGGILREPQEEDICLFIIEIFQETLKAKYISHVKGPKSDQTAENKAVTISISAANATTYTTIPEFKWSHRHFSVFVVYNSFRRSIVALDSLY